MILKTIWRKEINWVEINVYFFLAFPKDAFIRTMSPKQPGFTGHRRHERVNAQMADFWQNNFLPDAEMKCSRVELRNCRLQAVSHSVSVQSVRNGALLKNGGVKNKRSAFLAFCTFLRTLHLWADSSAFRHCAVYVSGRFPLLLASRCADVHTLTRAAFMTRKAIKRF